MPQSAFYQGHRGLATRHGRLIRTRMARLLPLLLLLIFTSAPACAQELPVGESEADYRIWLDADPGRRGQILSFESWEAAAGVRDVLPTWQVIRTASMWRECGGEPFEVPPIALWPGLTRTLAFIRDHVTQAVGPVEAVSGYRNPGLNACAHGAPGSAHQGYSALDLVPLQPDDAAPTLRAPVPDARAHAAARPLGYAFTLPFDTRASALGARANESPCAVLERGGDPEGATAAAGGDGAARDGAADDADSRL